MARKALERIRKGQKKPASAGFCFSAPRPRAPARSIAGRFRWSKRQALSRSSYPTDTQHAVRPRELVNATANRLCRACIRVLPIGPVLDMSEH